MVEPAATDPAPADGVRGRWRRWLPFLAWPRPGAALLRGELAAGLTVALIIVPQAVAYAGLAGMPLQTGIYAALLPALVAALWGASPRLSVGPTALSSLLVAASLSGLAAPGSAAWVGLAAWLALLSGAMQVALGVGRFGWILNLVSAPVLMGFTQAATLLIIASQLPPLLGWQVGLWQGLSQGGAGLWPDPLVAAFGLGSWALLALGRRFWPRLPMVMLVVLGAGLLSHWSGFALRAADVVGPLPQGLPAFTWPGGLTAEQLGSLLLPAMVITLVSFLETAASAKVENQRERRPWNDNQDLLAQGLAKLAAGATGSYPTSASFSRSAINLYAGARTGWATLFTTATVGLVLLWFMPWLAPLPTAVLAAVVVAALVGLVRPGGFVRLWRVSRVEALTAGLTFGVTLLTAPRIHWGVLAGVLAGLVHFLHHRLHPRIIEVGLHPDGSLRDRHLWHLPPLAPGLLALRMDAELDFAAASTLERTLMDRLTADPGLRHAALFAQPINRIDATGVEVFGQLRRVLAERGVVLHLSGLKLPLETTLRRAGELPEGASLRLYRSDAEALTAFAALHGPRDEDYVI